MPLDRPSTHRSKWVGLYIVKKEDECALRIEINYVGDDWLFIEEYMIKADDQVFTIRPSHDELERDNAAGEIWEWYDGLVSQSILEIVEAVVLSGNADLRFVGDPYYNDTGISDMQKNAMLVTLAAYEELGCDLSHLPDPGR